MGPLAHEFREEMASMGFGHRAGGIFSKRISATLYYWISVDIHSGDVLVGPVFPRLTKKIYEIAGLTSIPAKRTFPMTWGPPAFSHRLGALADEKLNSACSLVDIAERFLSDKTDLDRVIEALKRGELFSWNRIQVVAAGLAVLGKCNQLQELAREHDHGSAAEFVRTAVSLCDREFS